MNKTKLRRLVYQYFNDKISRSDCTQLLDYLNNANPDEVADIIDPEFIDLNIGPEFRGQESADLLRRIKSDPRFTQSAVLEKSSPAVLRFYRSRWFEIAAALLIFGTAAIVIFSKNFSVAPTKKYAAQQQVSPIIPGSNKGILTLAGGKTIVLKNAANGLLAQTLAGNVSKTNNGQIQYHAVSKMGVAPDRENMNTLSTPRGGTYEAVLSDGTKVWLNAASSITYPVAFTGKERHVTLTGEAYFEVAKNKDKPFYVSANNVQIRVLGTHFDIAAYNDDDEMTTTLLEGSVQISKNKILSLLKPGEKAVVDHTSDNIVVSVANIENTMAWKNGYFIFDDDNITNIMKKVSRWYDVSVSYQANVNDQKFGGTFYRSKSITELLQYLEKIGKVHFAVEGRRIIVMK